MRVREQTFPNKLIRQSNCDEIISPNGSLRFARERHTEETKRLLTRLEAIHLVKEIGLDKYAVRVTIQDGFSNSPEDWDRIRSAVLSVVAGHCGFLAVDIDHKFGDCWA